MASTIPSVRQLDLAPLFEAETVALVGASERVAYSVAIERNLRRLGFPMERFFPVHPTRTEAFGRPCYASLGEVPVHVGLAVVATGAGTVQSVLKQCADNGVDAALVLADGFAESGTEEGTAMQASIARIASDGGVRLVGPNCMGVVVPHRGLGAWAGDVPSGLRTGNVAAVFQSSGTLNLFLLLAAHRHLGLRLAVSAGNQAALDLGDYLGYAVSDPGAQVIVVFLESVTDAARFVAGLERAAAANKPVIALRVGRSERGRRNALAHTGNLAGGGVAWDSLLRQHGVVQVEDHDELLETAILFSACRPAPARSTETGVGLVTISGGDCTLLCDLAEKERISLPNLAPETRAEIVKRLEKPTVLGNPLDIENLQRQDEEGFFKCLDAFIGDSNTSLIAARLNFPTAITPGMRRAYAHIAKRAREQHKRVIFLTRASEPLADEWLTLFDELGAPLLKEYRTALRSIRQLLDFDAFLARTDPPSDAEQAPLVSRAALLDLVRASHGRVLDYATTETLLSAYGIPLAAARLVRSAAEAGAAARALGWPVALKVLSSDVPHKSDVGALALGLSSEADVLVAYERVLANVRRAAPDACVEGVLVQRMVAGVAETIVGVSDDPQLGPLTMFGLGGVFVEVMRDVAFRVGRLSTAEARSMLDDVRGAALLRGARGEPLADEGALVDVLRRVSHLASDLRDELTELDLNPLVVLPAGQGVLVVDALLVRRSP
jgi:acetate---CoA ligase (ADP-forming)